VAGVERAVSRAVAKSVKTGTARTDAERLLATCRPNHSLENGDLWWWKIVRHSKHQPPRAGVPASPSTRLTASSPAPASAATTDAFRGRPRGAWSDASTSAIASAKTRSNKSEASRAVYLGLLQWLESLLLQAVSARLPGEVDTDPIADTAHVL